MRYIIFFFVLFLFACQSEKSPSVAQYFDYTPAQKANAGVQMIPIQTEKRHFQSLDKAFWQQSQNQSVDFAWRSRTYARVYGMF